MYFVFLMSRVPKCFVINLRKQENQKQSELLINNAGLLRNAWTEKVVGRCVTLGSKRLS